MAIADEGPRSTAAPAERSIAQAQVLLPELVALRRASMGAEDFSCIAQRVPAMMLMLPASPPDLDGTPAPNHSPHAVFDDAVLSDQADRKSVV